ncbi:beta-galactosidase [Saliphagus sp. LR7]|uniref:beta-galactosidase n=1 Tax=Saliphagus sp. LR7 TaxID=2282654 RepID=UPI000DF7BCF6|nr:beta-galactosidase [Saliphagus sp. LR7]
MSIGVCYFPEHWPDEDWERDVVAMADAGLDYVRMAEFSWGVLEPERGSFEFEWLDRALDLIDDRGMQAVLCTPTAAPPRWLVDERPEILQQERDGTVREAGSRRHYCFNSPAYREETERVVRKLAERYADDSRVAGWQTDNEYGCHGTAYCYCDDCADAFGEWVSDRFEDAADLNEAWGTTFWSQQYDSLSDVDVPRPTPAQDHPALALAFARFTSDAILDYNRLQTEILREHGAPFVTHNFMHLYPAIDLHEASADLDFLSWDSYPTGHVQEGEGEASADELRAGDPDLLSLNHDLYRSVGGAPFWVMEQQPGDVNWPPHSPQPGEGAMRLWAHQAVAHGADSVVYFRWRRCLEGQEQYHAGLRKADGSPDRGYDDATEAAEEFKTLTDLDLPEAPVAILHDYETLWALDGREHAPDFDYWTLLGAFYDALRARGVAVDVVSPEDDLAYDAVIAPALYTASEETADRLEEFVREGGQLLLGPRSGVADEYNKLRSAQPGPLADLVGATVEGFETVPPELPRSVESEDGDRYPIRIWAEWLARDEAAAEYIYTGEDVTGGRPAVVSNPVGDGQATYAGLWPEPDLADELVGSMLERAGIDHTERFPDGVRVSVRDGHVWLCNFTSEPVDVVLDDGEWVLGGPRVEPFDVAVAETNRLSGLSLD